MLAFIDSRTYLLIRLRSFIGMLPLVLLKQYEQPRTIESSSTSSILFIRNLSSFRHSDIGDTQDATNNYGLMGVSNVGISGARRNSLNALL